MKSATSKVVAGAVLVLAAAACATNLPIETIPLPTDTFAAYAPASVSRAVPLPMETARAYAPIPLPTSSADAYAPTEP